MISVWCNLQQDDQMALMLISHDLAVVAGIADDVVIMKEGSIVDQGEINQVFRDLEHPYTRSLFVASDHVPVRNSVDERAAASAVVSSQSNDEAKSAAPLLEVTNLVCEYPMPRRHWYRAAPKFRAVDEVSFSVSAGESVGLVGESGCGKSTLTRAILGLMQSSSGSVSINGKPISSGMDVLRNLQVVFQDPYGSFNPKHRVWRLVSEPLNVLETQPSKAARRDLVAESLKSVGLMASDGDKYIHEFSGGQRQRIAIARALITRPALIVLDEAVSALDVSVRATVLDLLSELAATHGLAYLFISHDLSVVRNVTDRVLVMQSGKIVERGNTKDVFDHPTHEYTQRLVASVPRLPDYDHAALDPV